jgi:TP901 family phage tail tape measure protein
VLGVKVGLESKSVAQVKSEFIKLLDSLQERANKSVIKVDVDLKNMRNVNAVLNETVSGLKKLSTQTKDSIKTTNQLSSAYNNFAKTQKAINQTSTTRAKVDVGIPQLTEWFLIRRGIQQVIDQIANGFKFINDFNKSLTEISIVTGKNQASINALGLEYNKLAKEMSVTTQEIAKASVEFYRQGLAQDEVNKRLVSTTQYSKVANLQFEQSAEILTSTVNSMELDINRVTDVFTFLGDATATGADEIGIAFQKVGGSASALEVQFEKVASWIATLSSKTREGSEAIGNSIKSLMSRFQQLRERGFAEEDGTKVNQVAKALNEVGIQAMDATGNFRNFGDVMDELGLKWDSLDGREKSYISTTVAGAYQQNRFLNLMENYRESLDLYSQSLDSAGTTQNKFNIWLDSTEAHINKLRATTEGLWLKVFNSDVIKSFIDTLNVLVGGIDSVVTKFGGLPTLFATIGVTFGALKKNWSLFGVEITKTNTAMSDGSIVTQKYAGFTGILGNSLNKLIDKEIKWYNQQNIGNEVSRSSLSLFDQLKFAYNGVASGILNMSAKQGIAILTTGALKVASIALNTALTMGIGLLVGAGIQALVNYINKTKELKTQVDNLTQTTQSNMQNNNSNIRTLTALEETYNKLTLQTSLTKDEQQELVDIQNQIASIAPDVVSGYDAQGNAVIRLKDGVKGLVEELKKKNKEEQDSLVSGYGDASKVYNKETGKAQTKLDKSNEQKQFLLDQIKTSEELMSNYEKLGQASYVDKYKTVIADYGRQLKEVNGDIVEQEAIIRSATATMQPFKNAFLSVADGYDLLSEKQKKIAFELTSALDPKKYSPESFQEIVTFVSDKKFTDTLKQLESLNVTKGTISAKEFNEEIIKLYNELSNLTSGKISADALMNMFNIKPIELATASMRTFEKIQEDVINTMIEVGNQLKDVNTLLLNHKENGEWDYATISKLAEVYPELLNAMGDEEKLTQALINIKEKLVGSTDTQINAEIEAVKAQLDAYGINVDGFKTAEEAKTEIAKEGAINRLKIYEQEQKAIEETIKTLNPELAEDQTRYSRLMKNHSVYGANIESINSAINKWASLDDLKARASSISSSIGNSTNKSSKSETTIYESKLDGADEFLAVLEDINFAFSKQDSVIKEIDDKIKLYKAIGTNDAMTKSIEEQNNLYSEQANQISLLSGGLNTMNQQKDTIAQAFKLNFSSMVGADLNNWSKSDFTNMFQELFPTMTTTDKNKADEYNQSKQLFNRLTDDWFKYLDAIESTKNSISEVQTDMLTTMSERYDIYFKTVDQLFKNHKNNIGVLENELKALDDTDFDGREAKIKQIIGETEKYKSSITDIISQLKEKQSTLESGSHEWGIINEEVEKNESLLADVNSQIKDTTKELKENTIKEYDDYFDKISKNIDNIKNKLSGINKDRQLLDDSDYDSQLELINELVDETAVYKNTIELSLNELKGKQSLLKVNSDEWIKINDEVLKYEDLLKDAKIELKDAKDLTKELREEQSNTVMDMQDKIVDALRKQYETAKDAELEAIQNNSDKKIEIKETEIDRLKAELEAMKDDTQGKKDTLAKLQKELALWKEDTDSPYAKKRVLELEQQIKEKQKELAIDVKENEIKQAEDALDAIREKAEDEKEIIEKKYKYLLDEQRLYSQATFMMTNNSQEQILSLLLSQNTKYQTMGTTLGKSFSDAMLAEINKVKNALTALAGMTYSGLVDNATTGLSGGGRGLNGSSTTQSSSSSNSSSSGGSVIVPPSGVVIPSTYQQLKNLDSVFGNGQRFKSGGETGEWGSWGKLAILDEKERVLDASQTKAFNHLVYNILPYFNNTSTLGLNKQQAMNTFNAPVIQNDITITNNTPFDVSNNIDNLNKAIKEELKIGGYKIAL